VVFPEYRKILVLAFLFASYSRFCCIPLIETSPSVVANDFTRKPGSPVLFCVQCSLGNKKVVRCVLDRPETVRGRILSSKRRGIGGILVRVDLRVMRATLLTPASNTIPKRYWEKGLLVSF
jgi:hypothetical protein